MTDSHTEFALLVDATQRLVRTVDGLDQVALAEPSTLPGWSRAHVVAHLALNAEGLAGVLEGARRGEPTPMYVSDESRDADIAALAACGDAAALRDRFLAGTTRLIDAVRSLPADDSSGNFERTPGSRPIRLSAIPGMRLREVEIHHVDLAAGYTPAGWSAEFATGLLSSMVKRQPSAQAFQILATDTAQSYQVGAATDPHLVVSGPTCALGWWLTGRDADPDLTVNTGTLPTIESW